MQTVIEPGSVSVTFTIKGTTYTTTDDGSGNILGTNVSSGTIDYNSGKLDITFTSAPDSKTSIVATYNYRQKGFYLNFGKFGVTDQKGQLDSTRTINDTYKTWYQGNISNPKYIGNNTVEFYIVIPANVTSTNQIIQEIYIYTEDPQNSGDWLLFGIAQPPAAIEYAVFSEIRFRCQFTVTNAGTSSVIFKYTQAQEINDHNADINAHPDVQKAINKAGIFVNISDHKYIGQYWDEKATFDTSVTNGMLVYKASSGIYYPALADETEKSKVVGYADVNRGYVITSGLIETSLTYPAGTDLYLSNITPGEFTDQPTPTKVGLSLGNGLILLGTVGGSGKDSYTKEDAYYEHLLLTSSFSDCYYNKIDKPNAVENVSLNLSFDATNTALVGTAGEFIEQTILTNSTITYYKFLVNAVYDDSVAPTLEYSINGGTDWITANFDEIIIVNTGFTDLKIKITWNGSGSLYSFGVLYNESRENYITDTQAFEILDITANQTAPITLTLPNNMIYTPDGKSLEVYLNRQRLINGVDFTEIDNRTIKLNIDLVAGDTLVFIQKYGYVDTSVENKARLDYEHDSVGKHIFTDLSTGKKYRLAVDKGKLVLIQI